MDPLFAALMLLLVSVWLCLQQRPNQQQPNDGTKAEWRGESAARFAAGLLLLGAAAAELFQLPPNATWFQVEKAFSGHVLGTAEYMGTYSR